MPLPTPRDGESHTDWMSRCMAHPVMHREYPDTGQRRAVCESQWGRRAPLADWDDGELAGLLVLEAWPVTTKAPVLPVPASGRASTLFMTQKLQSQILGYHRRLLRPFNAAVRRLTVIAADPEANTLTTHQLGDARGEAVIAEAVEAFLAEAETAFPRAFDVGQALAVRFTGKSRLTDSEAAERVARLLARNRHFVTTSLFEDLREAFREILRDPALPAKAVKQTAPEAVGETGERMESRVATYATPVWGAGHAGFAGEMAADQRELDWVVTSLDACEDCEGLEDRGPYGPLNPLPTVPGEGWTRCRTNCLCLLVGGERSF